MDVRHQILPQVNTCERFWTNLLSSVLHHHHKNKNNDRGNIFWKKGVHPSSTVQRPVATLPRYIETVLVAHGDLNVLLDFSFVLSALVCSLCDFRLLDETLCGSVQYYLILIKLKIVSIKSYIALYVHKHVNLSFRQSPMIVVIVYNI